MKKTLSMILGVLITIVLLMNHVEVLAKSAEQEELENEKSKVDSQIKEAQEKQEQLEAEKSETMKTVESLITQISSVQKEVDELEIRKKRYALPWEQPTGTHDMYKAGEYMIWTGGTVKKCVQDTNFSPDEYPGAWE